MTDESLHIMDFILFFLNIFKSELDLPNIESKATEQRWLVFNNDDHLRLSQFLILSK